MNFSSLFQKEAQVGDRLPYSRHLNDITLVSRNGYLLQFIQLDGFAFETADTEELNQRLLLRDTMFRSLGGGRVSLYHHIVRRQTKTCLDARFADAVCRQIDSQWQNRLSRTNLFSNDLFLTLVYKPSEGRVGWVDRISDFFGRRKSDAQEQSFASELKALDSVRQVVLATLESYGARVLQRYQSERGQCSEPLELLSLLYNAELHPVLSPQGDLGHYIPYRRVSFGHDSIEIGTAEDRKFCAIHSIKDYPSHTKAGLLDGLLRLPYEMVVAESFRPVARQQAQERIDLALRRLRSADDDTITLRRGLREAKDDVASGQSGYGVHHLSVLVRAPTLQELDRASAKVQASLTDAGIISVREELNMEAAFWSQFPGNFDYAAREALVSSANMAGFCSLHGFPEGQAEGNHWGQAVTAFETTAASPYFFNFHQGDLGNFLVMGPSGSGKTVVLNFLTAQAQKFTPRTIFFDKDRGAEIFIRAIGGHYDILRRGKPSGFNPLQLADTAPNRAFLKDWLTCLLSSAGKPLSVKERETVADAIDANFEQPSHLRRLSYLRELLGGSSRPGAEDLPARLQKWVDGGEFAWLFDNANDAIQLNQRILGFDMTDLLDQPELRSPAMMYLFHCIEGSLDGSPSLIVIDEGWKALDDEIFRDRLKDWLKTIRKRNGVVGFCTQSVSDALKSSISSAIIEQTATQILMPNGRSQEADYRQGLGLSEYEFEIVKSLPENSRCFLVRQGGHSVVARLDLTAMPDTLKILSGRETSVRELDRLRRELGDAPKDWLSAFLGKKTPKAKPAAKSNLGRVA